MAIRTNYCTNPSLEAGADNALATGFGTTSTDVAGTIVYSKVAGRLGGLAQRVQYTGVAGDAAGKFIYIRHDITAAPFSPGDPVAAGVYLKGSISGCSAVRLLQTQNAAHAAIDTQNVATTIASGWGLFSSAIASAGALTGHVEFFPVVVTDIHEGDTVDITIDDVLIEKSAVSLPYFDGSYSLAHWTGPVNASASVQSDTPAVRMGHRIIGVRGVILG